MCDQPHPLLVAKIVQSCLEGRLQPAYVGMKVGNKTASLKRQNTQATAETAQCRRLPTGLEGGQPTGSLGINGLVIFAELKQVGSDNSGTSSWDRILVLCSTWLRPGADPLSLSPEHVPHFWGWQ